MSFDSKKRKRIVMYLLEKIDRRQKSVVAKTAGEFSVTPATVYRYIDDLIERGDIRKIKRGEYELVRREKNIILEAGEFDFEQDVYDKYVAPEIADLRKNAKDIWSYIFSEMANNVIDHSGAGTLMIKIERDALKTTISIYDNGVGIFNKIKDYFNLSSAQEAAGELFKGKLTTDAEHHSGEGIFFSSRLADTFVIVSSGVIFSHNKFSEDEVHDLVRDTADKICGTGVLISLSNATNKRVNDVFDKFADADGGFTKTEIPVKHYFESSPISRSQAKRLCSRIDKFSQIVLDFAEVDWMGQGFAHEIFVVFQNRHPEMEITPVNMSPDVEKMYRHVISG